MQFIIMRPRFAGMTTPHQDLLDKANDAAEAGEFAVAIAFFRQAVAIEPRRADALESLAQCLLETEDAKGAAEAAASAVRCDSTWAAAHLTLARAQLNSGAFAAAARSFEAAVGLDEGLREEAAPDLERARQLQLAQDERELTVGSVKLRLQQWRGDDGGNDESSRGGGCAGCAGRGEADETPRHGTGTMIWECGIVLAGYLMHSQGLQLGGRCVIELGSGSGVAGLAAAALGAQAVLTDLDPVARLLRANVRLNAEAVQHAGGAADVRVLDWSDAPPPAADDDAALGLGGGGPFAYVLCADLVYQPDGKQLPGLVATLRALLAPPADGTGTGRTGATLLLAHKSRHAPLDEQLLLALRASGIDVREVPRAEHHPEYRSSSVRIFSGTRLAGS